jgi:ATP-dependent helicase/nuclease subunit B
MITRVFLGWDRPFLSLAVDWLMTQRRDALPGLLVVVPTAQSGRRLREALAEAGGAVLAPRFTTPGALLQPAAADVAPDWTERLAWAETMEGIADWSEFAAAFPTPPGEGRQWAGALALEMTRLRRSLQENGLTLATAARTLAGSPEAERWQALAMLEARVDRQLADWGFRSRSAVLAAGLPEPAAAEIILAGVPELPPVLARAIAGWPLPVTALIGAPVAEADAFSPPGCPDEAWAGRPLPWPEAPGRVEVHADPRQQAAAALRAVAEAGSAASIVTLGAADPQVGCELARTFTRADWTAFRPGAEPPPTGLWRWMRVWTHWLAGPRLAGLADLLALPETGPLVGGRRAAKADRLAALRDRWMVDGIDELERLIGTMETGTDDEPERKQRFEARKTEAIEVLEAARHLEAWARGCLHGDFPAEMDRLLGKLAIAGDADAATAMSEWIHAAAPLIRELRRTPGFWIELMLTEVSPPAPAPPENRVIDIQGWLELFHEPGTHLVLCGMNEGHVPARTGNDPWLSESARTILKLPTQNARAARDAFLLQALLEARRHGGRVDLFCGKTGEGGETLLPSRLLLSGPRDDLPRRVHCLFREIEPPDAGMRWHADWQWLTPVKEPPARVNATAFADYLACPFRYYLKHVVDHRATSASRREWDHRDFGNAAHEVLERWGRDPEARDFSKTEAIEKWVVAEMERVIAERFGKRPPLAVRIQAEALRQRLGWFARTQACQRADGWTVIDVERKVTIAFGECSVSGKIDRIDRHQDGRLRLLDYKTGEIKTAEAAHRKAVKPATLVPPHLAQDGCPAVHEAIGNGKPYQAIWQNLQLPLYAAALADAGESLPVPGYFLLPAKAAETAVVEWKVFDEPTLDAARTCAAWITGQIVAGVFWPPAEKVKYDDFRKLAPVGSLAAAFFVPGDWQAGALPEAEIPANP